MIDNLIAGGIGFIVGMISGFMVAALLMSAKTYDDYEEYNDDDR